MVDSDNNIKKITEWEVLTPSGWQDFDGVKKTTKDSSVTITFISPENIEQSITCSKGHQLFIRRFDEQMFLFAELIDKETDYILFGDNKTFCEIINIIVNNEEVELYDLVNVCNGYEYITNGVVSHNCAHVDGIDELWLGLQPTLSCIVGDTLVLTNNGFVKIEDFHKNKNIGDYFDLEIPIYGKHGMELTSKGYVSPESGTIIVRTKHGHKVEVTPKHPLYSLQNDGFGKMIQTQQLKTGDYLRIEIGQNCFGKTNHELDVAHLNGMLIAALKTIPEEITTPKFILTGTKETVNAYLLGLLSDKQSISSNSERFLLETSLLLHNLGFLSSVKFDSKKDVWVLYKGSDILRPNNPTHCKETGDTFYWDEIVSMEKSHNKTYDFTVPKTHSFLQNGILGSNTGGSAILISSPAGVGNLFHRIWVDAKTNPNKKKEGKNGFYPIELPWTVHPERDQAWFNTQRAEIITAKGERGVGMELLCLSADTEISITGDKTKKIKNIKIGDIVLTHKGRYKSVTKLFKHKLKNNEVMYEVTVPGTNKKMLITNNHPILNYSFTVPKGADKIKYFKKALKNNEVSLSFNSIGELDFYKNIKNTNGRKITFGCLYPFDIDNVDLIELERHSVGELSWEAIPNSHFEETLVVYNIEVEDDNSYVANGFVVHNCNFASSGDTFIKGEALDDLMNAVKPPANIQSYNRDEVWFWEPPKPNNKYLIAADVSRGDADDFSAFCIIDVTENEIVADFKGKLPPDRFADLLVEHGRMYNTAMICQELNAVGAACATQLKSSKYPNLFYEKFQKNMYMSYMTQDIGDELPGYTMGANTRIELLAKLEATIRNKKIKLYSKRLFEEFQTFIWKNNKPQAQKGYNDDLILSLAIGCGLFEPDGNNNATDGTEAWALLAGMSRESKTIDPFTGNQKLHTKQTTTADGMWKTKNNNNNGNAASGNGVHNYNNENWNMFKWIFRD